MVLFKKKVKNEHKQQEKGKGEKNLIYYAGVEGLYLSIFPWEKGKRGRGKPITSLGLKKAQILGLCVENWGKRGNSGEKDQLETLKKSVTILNWWEKAKGPLAQSWGEKKGEERGLLLKFFFDEKPFCAQCCLKERKPTKAGIIPENTPSKSRSQGSTPAPPKRERFKGKRKRHLGPDKKKKLPFLTPGNVLGGYCGKRKFSFSGQPCAEPRKRKFLSITGGQFFPLHHGEKKKNVNLN